MGKLRKGQISFTAGEISPRLAVRNDLAKFDNALEECLNFVVSPYGAIYRRPGTQYVAAAKSNSNSSRLVSFEYSDDETYVLEFSNGKMRVFADQAQVLSLGSPYELNIPYSNSELADLRFAQSFNTLYVVHGDYAPREIVRVAADNWTINTVAFDEPAFQDENTTSTTLTPSGTTGSITVTASSATFVSTDVGRAIRYKAGPDESDRTIYTGTGSQTYFDIPFFPNASTDVEVYLVATNGSKTLQTNPSQYSVSNGQVVMTSAPTVSQSVIIQPKNVGSGEWGWMTITAYSSSTSVTASVGRELGGTVASDEWKLGAWSPTTGYPSSITIHEQRLWLASTETQPETFWASEIGVYTNFQPDNALYKGGVDDSTSFTFSIGDSKVPHIQWMAAKGAMLIGTANGIFSLQGVNGAAISALNIPSVRKQTDVPCAFKPVAETQNEVLFIDRNKRRVYSLGYQFEIDGFKADDLTLLAEHFGNESTIEEITFQGSTNIVWVRRADGSLLSCTYIKGQDVNGWAQHTIAGTNAAVESITVISGAVYDEPWISIARTIGGGTVRYIEYLHDQFFLNDKADAKFLDSMLTYSGSSATTITGLTHLNGETVSILANGNVHPTKVVSGGSITLDYAVTKAQIGLAFNSSAQTLDLSGGSVIGTSQGAISRINQYSIRFFETLGAKVGYDSTNPDLIGFRGVNDPMNSSPPLFTGYKSGSFPQGWKEAYKVYLIQDQPLPMSVLGIVVTANVTDN